MYSVSGIQVYFDYIINKHETVADNLPIQIYTNKIKNRVVFKIVFKHLKLKFLSKEMMRLLGSR